MLDAAAGQQVPRLANILRETGRLAQLAVEADHDGQIAEASLLYTRTCVLLKQCLRAAHTTSTNDSDSDTAAASLDSNNYSSKEDSTHDNTTAQHATTWQTTARTILISYESRIALLARSLPTSRLPANPKISTQRQTYTRTTTFGESPPSSDNVPLSAAISPANTEKTISDTQLDGWFPLGSFHPLPPVNSLRNSSLPKAAVDNKDDAAFKDEFADVDQGVFKDAVGDVFDGDCKDAVRDNVNGFYGDDDNGNGYVGLKDADKDELDEGLKDDDSEIGHAGFKDDIKDADHGVFKDDIKGGIDGSNMDGGSDSVLGELYSRVALLSDAVVSGGFITRAVFLPSDLFGQTDVRLLSFTAKLTALQAILKLNILQRLSALSTPSKPASSTSSGLDTSIKLPSFHLYGLHTSHKSASTASYGLSTSRKPRSATIVLAELTRIRDDLSAIRTVWRRNIWQAPSTTGNNNNNNNNNSNGDEVIDIDTPSSSLLSSNSNPTISTPTPTSPKPGKASGSGGLFDAIWKDVRTLTHLAYQGAQKGANSALQGAQKGTISAIQRINHATSFVHVPVADLRLYREAVLDMCSHFLAYQPLIVSLLSCLKCNSDENDDNNNNNKNQVLILSVVSEIQSVYVDLFTQIIINDLQSLLQQYVQRSVSVLSANFETTSSNNGSFGHMDSRKKSTSRSSSGAFVREEEST